MEYTGFIQSAPAQKRYEGLVDCWQYDDADPDDAPQEATGTPLRDADGEAIYEWAPSGFFLVHRWHARVGEPALGETRIVSYQPDRGDYFSRLIERCMHPACADPDDGEIRDNDEPDTCATIAVRGGCIGLDIAWKWLPDGSDWLPVCDLVSHHLEGAQAA